MLIEETQNSFLKLRDRGVKVHQIKQFGLEINSIITAVQ